MSEPIEVVIYRVKNLQNFWTWKYINIKVSVTILKPFVTCATLMAHRDIHNFLHKRNYAPGTVSCSFLSQVRLCRAGMLISYEGKDARKVRGSTVLLCLNERNGMPFHAAVSSDTQ